MSKDYHRFPRPLSVRPSIGSSHRGVSPLASAKPQNSKRHRGKGTALKRALRRRQWRKALPEELPVHTRSLRFTGSIESPRAHSKRGVERAKRKDRTLEVFLRRRQWGEASPKEPPVRTKCGLEAPGGFEPPHRSFAACPTTLRLMMTNSYRVTLPNNKINNLLLILATYCDCL